MATNKTLLERMREERDELDAAIRVVERMTGAARTAKAIRDVDVAMAMAASKNGHGVIDAARKRMNPPPKALKATRTWMHPATPKKPKRKATVPRRYGSASNLRKRREKSAQLLARFDSTEPRPSSVMGNSIHGLGPLVRRGYLEKTDDGYIRTAKAYVP